MQRPGVGAAVGPRVHRWGGGRACRAEGLTEALQGAAGRTWGRGVGRLDSILVRSRCG